MSDIDVDPNQDDDLVVGYEEKDMATLAQLEQSQIAILVNWAAENSTKVLSFGKDAAGVSMNKSLYNLHEGDAS